MEPSSYVVVGAFARIDLDRGAEVRACLDAITGVSTFPLAQPEKLGVLIEAADVDAAHQVLTGPVRHTAGVLGVWPVSVHADESFDAAYGSGTVPGECAVPGECTVSGECTVPGECAVPGEIVSPANESSAARG